MKLHYLKIRLNKELCSDIESSNIVLFSINIRSISSIIVDLCVVSLRDEKV